MSASIGVKSLRDVLLSSQAKQHALPCPAAAKLRELLSTEAPTLPGAGDAAAAAAAAAAEGEGGEVGMEHGGVERVLTDLLEVAETMHCSGVRVMLDDRQHGVESLIHPALVDGQGPALVVVFDNQALTSEDLVRTLNRE